MHQEKIFGSSRLGAGSRRCNMGQSGHFYCKFIVQSYLFFIYLFLKTSIKCVLYIFHGICTDCRTDQAIASTRRESRIEATGIARHLIYALYTNNNYVIVTVGLNIKVIMKIYLNKIHIPLLVNFL